MDKLMNILDNLKEFLRGVFSQEFLQQIIGYLQKAQEYAGKAVEWVREFIEWLYNAVAGFFG